MWRQLLFLRSALHIAYTLLLHLAPDCYALHEQPDAALVHWQATRNVARCSSKTPACLQDTKRARLSYFDGDSDTDESDAEDLPVAGAASAVAAAPKLAAALASDSAVTAPSGGPAAPSTGPAQVVQLLVHRSNHTSTACHNHSTECGIHAQQSSCCLSQARLGPDTSAAAAVASADRQASVTSPRPKSGREASVASNAQVHVKCASLPPSGLSCCLAANAHLIVEPLAVTGVHTLMVQEVQPVSSSSGASAATASVAASAGQANSPIAVSGAQSAKSAPSAAATAAAPAAVPTLDLSQYPDAKALEALGIDALKVLMRSSVATACHMSADVQ